MAHTPHELHEEFPDLADKITELKTGDAQFARLADEYHALNRAIHRIECEVETTSDTYLTRLRRQRLALLDEIAAIIEEAEGRYGKPADDTPTPPAAGLIFGAPPKNVSEAANDQAVPA